MFVYVSETCQQQAKEFGLTDKLSELKHWTEKGNFYDFAKMFEIFTHPYYVYKKLRYYYRLLVRYVEVVVNNKSYGVAVFFSLLHRGNKEYDDFYFRVKKQGDLLYNQQKLEKQLETYISERLMRQSVFAENAPVLVNDSQALQYFLQAKINVLNFGIISENQEYYQETLYWRYFKLPTINEIQIENFFDMMQQSIVSGNHTHFCPKQYPLFFSPIPPITLGTQDEINNPLNRKLPIEIILDKTLWYEFQSHHLPVYLNELGKQVFDKIFNENKHFGLLIDAPILHGKSSLMAMLSLHYATQNNDEIGLPYLVLYSSNNQAVNMEYNLGNYEKSLSSLTQFNHFKNKNHRGSFSLLWLLAENFDGNSEDFYESFINKHPDALFVDMERFQALWKNSSLSKEKAFVNISSDFIWEVIYFDIKGQMGIDELMPVIPTHLDKELYELIYQKVWLEWYQPLGESGYWDLQDVLLYFNAKNPPLKKYKAILIDDAHQYSKLAIYTILKHSIYWEDPSLFFESPVIFMGNQFYRNHWQKNVQELLESIHKQHKFDDVLRLEKVVQSPIFITNIQKCLNSYLPNNDVNFDHKNIQTIELKIKFVDVSDKESIFGLLWNNNINIIVNNNEFERMFDGRDYLKNKSAIQHIFEFSRKSFGYRISNLNNDLPKSYQVALLDFYHFELLDLLVKNKNNWDNIDDDKKSQLEKFLKNIGRAVSTSVGEIFIVGNQDEMALWQSFFADILLDDMPIINIHQIYPRYFDILECNNALKKEAIEYTKKTKTNEKVLEMASRYRFYYQYDELMSFLLETGRTLQNYQLYFDELDNERQKELAFIKLWQPKYEKLWLEYEQHCPQSLKGNLMAIKIAQNTPLKNGGRKSLEISSHQPVVWALKSYGKQYQSDVFGDYWQVLIELIFKKLSISTKIKSWALIFDELAVLLGQKVPLPLLLVADIYHQHNKIKEALIVWELAKAQKLALPSVYYQLKLQNAKNWQETLIPLLKLHKIGAFMNIVSDHLNELQADYWEKILPYIQDERDLQSVLYYFLPKIQSQEVLQKILDFCQYDNSERFVGRVQRLLTARACLNGDWETVIARLEHYFPANTEDILSKLQGGGYSVQTIKLGKGISHREVSHLPSFHSPHEEVVAMLYALNLNPELQLLSDPEAYDVYSDLPHIDKIFYGLQRILSVKQGEKCVWNTNFVAATTLGALLEKSSRLEQAIDFYQGLLKHPKTSKSLQQTAIERLAMLYERHLVMLPYFIEREESDAKADYERYLYNANKSYADVKTVYKSQLKTLDTAQPLIALPPQKDEEGLIKYILTLSDKEQREINALEKEMKKAQKAEQERLEKEHQEQERAEQERLKRLELEQKRMEQEQAEQERLEKEHQEQERLAKEKAEQERLLQEKAEQERLAQETAKQERLVQERAEQEKAEQARLAQERAKQAKAEQERLEKEKQDAKQLTVEASQATLAPTDEPVVVPIPVMTVTSSPVSPAIPTPPTASNNTTFARATSELNFFGWRVFVVRLHKRLNLECTQTGQRLSLYWQMPELHSDWHYHQDGNRFVLVGLPLVLEVVGDRVKLHHTEHQIELWV